MGTHPIFESDFDCLTDGKSGLERKMSFYVGDPTANQPKGFVAQPYAQQVATFNPTVGSKPTVLPAQAGGQGGYQIQPQFPQIGQQPQLITAQPRAISMQHGMIQPMMQYRP